MNKAVAIATSLALVLPPLAPAAAQSGAYTPPPPNSGYAPPPPGAYTPPPPDGYAPPPPGGGYAPPPPGGGYAPPPPSGGYTPPPPGGGYAPPPPGGYTPPPPGGGYAPPPPRPGAYRPNPAQAYLGQVSCYARGNNEQYCRVPTQNRVELLRLDTGQCVQGRDWSFDANGIRVRNNCRALFGYGYAAGYPGGYPAPGRPYPNQTAFAGQTLCYSRGFREQYCPAPTQNRVEVVRLDSGQCVQGRDWSFDDRGIRVRNNCGAVFGYGYLGGQPQGGGISTGGAIAGAAVAAGLIALLANRGKNNRPAAGVAAIDAEYSQFGRDSQREGRACMAEAARQVGSTGGQRVALGRVESITREVGGGQRIVARVTGAYDNRATEFTMTCIANGDRVTAFDVR